MTDRIEKIVSKWGFEPMQLEDWEKEEQFVAKFIREYRGFRFTISIHEGWNFSKAIVYCRTDTEDDKVLAMHHDLGLYRLDKDEDKYLDIEIRNTILKFIERAFKYDLFHDKEWEDE